MPPWSKELDDKLRELAAFRSETGVALSASDIALRLGVSRNAVIGRCYRKDIHLGRASDGSGKSTKTREERMAEAEERAAKRAEQKRASAQKYRDKKRAANPNWGFSGGVKVKIRRKPKVAFNPDGQPISRRLTVLQLDVRDCRFIGTEPSRYCGHPTVGAGVAYCAWHCRLMYTEAGYARILGKAA